MSNPLLINASQLQQKSVTDEVVIIDTRSPEAFAVGHIPNAVNIHDIFTFLASSTPEGIEELKNKFAKTFGTAGLSGPETAILYEDSLDTGFGQSCRGYFLLSYLGYENIKILQGGYQSWLAENFPISKEPSTPIAKQFPLKETGNTLMVNKDDVLAALETEIKLLDVRDVDEWIADSSSPYGKDFSPRKGRLPGAVWIEWYRMMKPGMVPMFKSPDEILAECQTVGIDKKTPIYLYCFKGARASNTFVALKSAGIENVKMYFGSWNEWSQDPSLPIEEGLPF
ncbi:thiosulfate sulfurtransferase [Thiomicrorhabdus immobilis]|uniref:Thiosulfate sulfurtransferase n=1 Tax=Thiomicrorhabdus immobilis TaxID=2791037 RepID=A0ABN6CYU3_9GAMM|nr:sulfurtransferase [Thiomicrorhabdus immobilis]BCN92824.1 thiosulfate sulfurtransferase [Thiomicrorhabdus immobilis]